MDRLTEPKHFLGVPNLAEVAALVGDPSRANMLSALMDGRALTAGELGYIAGVSPGTASEHLAKLTAGHLVAMQRQGRHKYFRLASPLVGRMLEGLLAVAADGPARYRPSSRLDASMREARTCYDHLAGRVAVDVTGFLVQSRYAVLADEGGEITNEGLCFLSDEVGVDLQTEITSSRIPRRRFCRPCLDWSERRLHLAGTVGAALCRHYLARGWTKHLRDTRALEITPLGRAAFADLFNISFSAGNAEERRLT